MMHIEYCPRCKHTYFYYKYRYVCPRCRGALMPVEEEVEKFICLNQEERQKFIEARR